MPTDTTRRALLLSLIAAAAPLDEQDLSAQDPQAAPDPSLYIPRAHVVQERNFSTISWRSSVS